MDHNIKKESGIIVTVGIPIYNADRFLESSIKSVLSQTFTNFELILSNDGSTDRSREIIYSFNDPRIKILDDGKNLGLSARLNEQVQTARGKYFARMDADDIMFPDRLFRQVNYLEANPETDVLGSAAVIIDDDSEILGVRDALPNNLSDSFANSAFIHPTVIGKLEWFRKNPYDSDLDGAEDFDLWLRTYNNSTFRNLEEPLLFYRDPPVFKLSTYLSRLEKQRNIFRKNDDLKNNFVKRSKILVESYLKSEIAKIISFLGKDNYIIARRNKNIATRDDKSRYNNILKKFI